MLYKYTSLTCPSTNLSLPHLRILSHPFPHHNDHSCLHPPDCMTNPHIKHTHTYAPPRPSAQPSPAQQCLPINLKISFLLIVLFYFIFKQNSLQTSFSLCPHTSSIKCRTTNQYKMDYCSLVRQSNQTPHTHFFLADSNHSQRLFLRYR